MNKNNRYFECLKIIIFCMKICGIFPFLFSHRETTRILLLSRIITIISILLYALIFGQEILYLISTANLLRKEFNFIIFIRLVFCLACRIIFVSIPVTTWRNSDRLHALWKKWQNFQEEIDDIKQAQFTLGLAKMLFKGISIFYILCTFIAIPFKSFFNDYKQFAASIESFYYLGVILLSIITYWSATCLFLIFIARELQRLIEKAITHEQHEVILRLLTLWLNLYDWKKEFISAHSNLFLIFISGMQWTFVTSVYSILFILIFEAEKLTSLWYFLTAFFSLSSIVTFYESSNLFYEQMVVRIQEILLSKNITEIDFRFLKQIEIFFLTIEVHKQKTSLNGVITLDRSIILTISANTMNYLLVLKQFHR